MADPAREAARAAAMRACDAGDAALQLHRWAEAEAHYSASLDVAPTAAAFNNRAAARLALHRPAEARDDALAALQLDASIMDAYLRLSAAHKATGDDAAALAAAEAGLARVQNEHSLLASQLRDAAAAARGPRA